VRIPIFSRSRNLAVVPSGESSPHRAAPADGEWRNLAPIQRVAGPLMPTAAASFQDDLASWQSPAFLRPLDHAISPDGPSGLIGSVPAVAAPRTRQEGLDLVLAHRAPAHRPAARSLLAQRATSFAAPSPPAVRSPLVSSAASPLALPDFTLPAVAELEDDVDLSGFADADAPQPPERRAHPAPLLGNQVVPDPAAQAPEAPPAAHDREPADQDAASPAVQRSRSPSEPSPLQGAKPGRLLLGLGGPLPTRSVDPPEDAGDSVMRPAPTPAPLRPSGPATIPAPIRPTSLGLGAPIPPDAKPPSTPLPIQRTSRPPTYGAAGAPAPVPTSFPLPRVPMAPLEPPVDHDPEAPSSAHQEHPRPGTSMSAPGEPVTDGPATGEAATRAAAIAPAARAAPPELTPTTQLLSANEPLVATREVDHAPDPPSVSPPAAPSLPLASPPLDATVWRNVEAAAEPSPVAPPITPAAPSTELLAAPRPLPSPIEEAPLLHAHHPLTQRRDAAPTSNPSVTTAHGSPGLVRRLASPAEPAAEASAPVIAIPAHFSPAATGTGPGRLVTGSAPLVAQGWTPTLATRALSPSAPSAEAASRVSIQRVVDHAGVTGTTSGARVPMPLALALAGSSAPWKPSSHPAASATGGVALLTPSVRTAHAPLPMQARLAAPTAAATGALVMAQRNREAALATGLATPDAGGGVTFPPPLGEPPSDATPAGGGNFSVSRAAAPSEASPSGTPAAAAASPSGSSPAGGQAPSGADLDLLARRIYDRIVGRLITEHRLGRERSGRLIDMPRW
jgi:hypothetical protein